jgi:hypothetical protein
MTGARKKSMRAIAEAVGASAEVLATHAMALRAFVREELDAKPAKAARRTRKAAKKGGRQ